MDSLTTSYGDDGVQRPTSDMVTFSSHWHIRGIQEQPALEHRIPAFKCSDVSASFAIMAASVTPQLLCEVLTQLISPHPSKLTWN